LTVHLFTFAVPNSGPLATRSMTDATSNESSNTARRVLTAHHPDDTNGSHVVVTDSSLSLGDIRAGGSAMAIAFATQGLPVHNSHTLTTAAIDQAVSLASKGSIGVPNGINGRFVELGRDGHFPMHRTNTIDYNIIVAGSVSLLTPTPTGMTRTVLGAGDVVIQRGTLHGWMAGPEGARWFSVIIDAQAVQPGTPLPPVNL
jgi:hypothetical protein